MLRTIAYSLVGCALLAPASGWGEVVKGRIAAISHKAHSIAVGTKGDPLLVGFDEHTAFVAVDGPKQLNIKDLVEITYEPGRPASEVKRMVFSVPPDQLYEVADILRLLQQGGEYHLFDARPAHHYAKGHVPTAASLFRKELEKRLAELPEDKSALVIFYCGGPTCPFSRQSAEVATAAGYTNIKIFNAGIPGWKKAGMPVAASAEWLEKSLDPAHVVLDVRSDAMTARSHIPTAVAMPVDRFGELTEQFVRERTPARLPGVADKAAPIVLVAETDTGWDVFTAFKALKQWGYKNVAILEGGLEQWRKDGRKLDTGAGGGVVAYVKKLKKGAVAADDFVATAFGKKPGVLLDVRAATEVADGKIFGARHIPLDALQKRLGDLPKDQPVVAYCTNGIRAEMAYNILVGEGYQVSFLNEAVNVKPNGTFVLE